MVLCDQIAPLFLLPLFSYAQVMTDTPNSISKTDSAVSTNRLAAQKARLLQLYPQLSDAKRERAKENLDRYLALALRIFVQMNESSGVERRFDK